MSSMYGNKLKVQIFGQSHSKAIGAVIDGIPAGFSFDMDKVNKFMARRAPGQNIYSTQRQERDLVNILSGIVDSKSVGAPIAAIIKNTDTRSEDYKNIIDIPRPSHSDYTAYVKHNGENDVRGGGHFSGRLTAPLVFAGALASQILEAEGIYIGAHISKIYNISDSSFDPINISIEDLEAIKAKTFPVIDDNQGQLMKNEIEKARNDLDSVGGIIECAVINLPAGIGQPNFEGLENVIAKIMFGIPAVKGIEFGNGFASTDIRGNQNNDPFYYDGDKIKTKTNNHGGILGGISSGMPLIFRLAIKPTASISQEQNSISLSKKENVKLVIRGRHDPCIVPRAVPVVEAACAIAILDLII